MPENDNNNDVEAAGFFFKKARIAAKSEHFDEAIELYIEALRRAPETVEEGHIKLRELAGRRQIKGGPKPTRAEEAERLTGKGPLERMLNAEYLLAKNPSHIAYSEAMLKGAAAGGYKKTAKWIADLMFLSNNRAKRPSFHLYILLKDSYAAIGHFKRALATCECAARLRPGDEKLQQECEELSKKRASTDGVFEIDGPDELGDKYPEGIRPEVGQDTANRPIDPLLEEEFDPAAARAIDLFSKARQVAEANDLDYAIELYLQGLGHTPDALEQGHLPVCELALERQKKGGKKPSMMEKAKRMRGKTALERMLNAEFLFAKDPSHLPYARVMLKAAVSGNFKRTANWIANYLFQENNALEKPSFQTYLLLKDSYRALGQFDKALAACQRAVQLKPNDGHLSDELRDLTAELTVSRGKYDQEGDFRKSIKDRESQEKLLAQEGRIMRKDYRVEAVEDARKALAKAPNLPKNIFNLAQTLCNLEDEKAESEAIALLESAYKDKKDFSFAQRAGQIRIQQLQRKVRELKDALEAGPQDAEAKGRLKNLEERLNEEELEHYRLCVENYPTDLQVRYEYGVRLFRKKQYDQAIPLFQEAQKDPRHRISAMNKIGLCFFQKGWYTDAIDVLTEAIESCEIKDDDIAKELRYNLGRACEQEGDSEKALEIYRKIAQLDFGFKDVRRRVDKLRKSGNPS